MFEQSALSSGPASSRVLGTFAGFGGQAVLVSVAVVAPMVFPQILPRAALTTSLVAPGAPPRAPNPGSHVIRPRGEQRAATQFRDNVLVAPTAVPDRARIFEDPEPVPQGAGVTGGVPGGMGQEAASGTLLRDILDQGAPPAAPARTVARVEPQPQPAAQPVPRVPVGGIVRMARVVSRIEPVYPVPARQMRVSGVVQLEGVIGIDGRLKELRVLSGHPLLVRAAVDAVRQWIYEPTTLNGRPVEVIAPITVTFRLN
jgi:protein TonB